MMHFKLFALYNTFVVANNDNIKYNKLIN